MTMIKKIIALILIIALVLPVSGCSSVADSKVAGQEPVEQDPTLRKFTDLADRDVTIPIYPSRIAAMTGPSYEMIFMLDGQDRISMTKSGHTTNYPVALLTNPALADYDGIGANPSSSVNIEDYLSRDIDLVIYYLNNNELQKFDVAGIPSIVLTLNTGLMESVDDVKKMTIDEYIDNSICAVKMLADVLGEDAVTEYNVWEKYCTDKLNMLYERTKDLTDEELKTVYWGNTWGENILSSYALKNRYYEIRLCGGMLLGPKGGNGNFPEVTTEQLFSWDPEVILVDNHGNYPELVIKDMYREDSKWASLQAVQNHQLHRIPAGVFFMDKGTTTTLMLVWLSTVLQPELFSDIDIIEEIQYYYKEFYEFDLSKDQAVKIINGWYERIEE